MMKLQTICAVAFAVATTSCFASAAKADTIADAMSRATFDRSGDTFRNTGIDRQATLLFGLSYPDLDGVSDSRSVDNIYQDGLRQRGGVPISTADLPNPFTSSLLTNPPKVGPRFD
jgi:hypothetical protein